MESPAISSSATPTPEDKASRRRETFKKWLLIVAVAMIAGTAGGAISPYVLGWAAEHGAPGAANLPAGVSDAQTRLVAEDDAITGLVEKNAPGVVSIVVSKEVSRLRAQSPFGGFPFFFDPFASPAPDAQGQGNSGKQQIGSGSGFFVSPDGLIVTNKHVVSDEQADYTVTVNGGKEYPAKGLARDPNNDIAVLKIEGSGFPALDLGDSDQVKVGETAIAIGNPLGEFANSVSRGIVSGVERNLSAGSPSGEEEELYGIIQTDAAINPGNSGGPLFDISGRVIGVNVAMAQGAENIGFALPINQVKRIVDQVEKTGKISTPYIGVRYIMLNESIQKQSGLPYSDGALVIRGQNLTDFAVVPGSPADKAGIAENDIILEVGGKKVDREHPLGSLLAGFSAGDTISLKIWHKGSIKEMKLTLEERE